MDFNESLALPMNTVHEKTVQNSKTLRMQFPVSSGQLHRRKENTWIHEPTKSEQAHRFGFSNRNNNNISTAVVQPMPIPVAYPGQPMLVQPGLGSPMLAAQHHEQPLFSYSQGQLVAYPSPLQREQMFGGNSMNFNARQGFDEQYAGNGSNNDFPCRGNHRFSGMRRMQQNPNSSEAMNRVKEVKPWSRSNHESGQYTGMGGPPRFLSEAELSSGTQAWARKDQLISAAPVQSGKGETMLQKMGWKPGEGLGKNKEGTLELPQFLIKKDKKGLVAPDEFSQHTKFQQSKDIAKNFHEGKHPVSLLNELCLRKRYGPPHFDCCYEIGPDSKKNFVFKVTVNGVEYKSDVTNQNKKQAKVEAATLCLKSLGLI